MKKFYNIGPSITDYFKTKHIVFQQKHIIDMTFEQPFFGVEYLQR